jgi:hypothetical protein
MAFGAYTSLIALKYTIFMPRPTKPVINQPNETPEVPLTNQRSVDVSNQPNIRPFCSLFGYWPP